MQQRHAMCTKANVRVRSWVPSTMVTMTNALAAMFKEGPSVVGSVVPSVPAQFPQYTAFFCDIGLREKRTGAQKQEVSVLGDDEVERLYDATNFESFFEAQWMNILLLAYSLGQRPETFQELTI